MKHYQIYTIFVLISILLILLYRYIQYGKKLFIRAWKLELKLISIYSRCPEDVQKEIEEVINSIEPL